MKGMKLARIMQGKRQADLAREMRVTPVTICNWEEKSIPLSKKRKKKISRLLNISEEKIEQEYEFDPENIVKEKESEEHVDDP